ncbi:MAG TPA: hypothetical protein VHO24_00400 [Opitutaceae bacterium]|nr:hypothetical protein [Opitutaceae bacterium]
MKFQTLFLALCGTGLTGCATATPSASSALVVTGVASETLGVLQPKLVSKQGQLELIGWVYKMVGGPSTAATHLDLVFLDGADRTLSVKTVQFEPRILRHARPPAGRGHYTFSLDALPPGTVRIEVRAHDAPDHSA